MNSLEVTFKVNARNTYSDYRNQTPYYFIDGILSVEADSGVGQLIARDRKGNKLEIWKLALVCPNANTQFTEIEEMISAFTDHGLTAITH